MWGAGWLCGRGQGRIQGHQSVSSVSLVQHSRHGSVQCLLLSGTQLKVDTPFGLAINNPSLIHWLVAFAALEESKNLLRVKPW